MKLRFVRNVKHQSHLKAFTAFAKGCWCMWNSLFFCEWQILKAMQQSISTWVVVQWRAKRAPVGLTDRPVMGDDSPASSHMNSWRPRQHLKLHLPALWKKRKYSNGNRKAVNHKPKVSYVMLVRQWVVLYWWRGKSFLPFRRRIATVIPLTSTLNRQMPFNCQKQPIVWMECI